MQHHRKHAIWMISLLIAVTLSACSSSSDDKAVPTEIVDDHGHENHTDGHDDPVVTPEACTPNQAVFEQNILPALARNCNSCHDDPPQFGAPFALLSYDEIVAGDAGVRISDKALDELMLGTMPPGGQIPHEDLDTLVAWFSCGEEHPDSSHGVVASKPVFSTTEAASPNYEVIDITAVGEEVGPTVLDDYRNFYFDNLVTEDKFIRRIEPVIDDSRVIHHITLQYDLDEGGVSYIYAWAPGTGPVELPGGLRLRPTDRLKVEIHYNNGAGATDVSDSSGMRIYLDDTVGTEYAMLDVTTYSIFVAPHSSFTAVAKCTADQEYTILAGMPHMHETGSEFKQEIVRADGTREELFSLTGWSFEYQPFYQMAATINIGDRLETTCTYQNDTDSPVQVGQGTSDEMCFNFLYVTPATVAGECREDDF